MIILRSLGKNIFWKVLKENPLEARNTSVHRKQNNNNKKKLAFLVFVLSLIQSIGQDNICSFDAIAQETVFCFLRYFMQDVNGPLMVPGHKWANVKVFNYQMLLSNKNLEKERQYVYVNFKLLSTTCCVATYSLEYMPEILNEKQKSGFIS